MEDPTVEKPKEEEVKPKEDAQLLMEELKKLDIETPSDIQNMAFASQETGKAWQEVGNLRKQVEQLTSQVNAPKQEYNPEYGETVDLGKVVEEKVQGVLNNYLAGQQQSQQAAMRAMNEVRSDEDYHIVGGGWENYISQPNVVMKLQSGEIDYVKEYSRFAKKYFKNLAKRTSETFVGQPQQKPPHIEQGDTQSAPMVEANTEKAEKFKNIKKAQREGTVSSDQALEQVIKTMLPDANIDPSFFQP